MAISDLDILRLIAEQQQQTHYARISVVGELNSNKVNWYDEPIEIDGLLTGGNLSYSGSSSVRRTGSLSMIALDDVVFNSVQGNYHLTSTDNIVSINKIIKVEIGLAITERIKLYVLDVLQSFKDENAVSVNEDQVLEDLALVLREEAMSEDIIWQKLGVYVITDASVTRSLSGWNITLNIQDQMALLNGTCGGTISNSVTHSPIYVESVVNGKIETSTDYPLYTTLISEFLEEFTGLSESDIYVWKDENSPEPEENHKAIIKIESNTKSSQVIKNIVSWKGAEDAYLTEIANINVGIETEPTYIPVYSVETLNSGATTALSYGDSIGYQYLDFTYPTGKELTSAIGETVTSILDKIKNKLGNYEYFYDVNGIFHFQEIDNGILQGSFEINIGEAIEDSYLAVNTGTIVYSFDTDDLIVSYTNNPQYRNVKNDFTVWGEKADTNTAIRYRLIVDKIPEFPDTDYQVALREDSFGVLRAYNTENEEEKVTIPVLGSDWRRHYYFQQVLSTATGDDNPYGLELQQELPKIMNIQTGKYYATLEEGEKAETTPKLNDMEYYIDIIDPSVFTDETVKKVYEDLTVSKIGRRTWAQQVDGVNCIFSPIFPELVYIPLGQENTAELRSKAITEQTSFVQVSPDFNKNISIGSAQYSAFDAIRTELNNMLGYCNTITLQTMPLYFLEPNTLIQVKDEKSDIDGVYQINSIVVSLTYNGTMTIAASKVLKYI